MRRTSRATSPPSPWAISSSTVRSRRWPGYAKKLSAARSSASAVSTAARPALWGLTFQACAAETSLYQRSSRASAVENSRSMRSAFGATDFIVISPRSKQRNLVVEDESERLHHVLAAVLDVRVAEPELKSFEPGEVPGDVEVALVNPGERAMGRPGILRVGARGVAHERREPGDSEGDQRSVAEVVFRTDAPRFLARPIEVFFLERQIAGPGAVGCLQRGAVAGDVEGGARGQPPPYHAAPRSEAQGGEVADEVGAGTPLVGELDADLGGEILDDLALVLGVGVRGIEDVLDPVICRVEAEALDGLRRQPREDEPTVRAVSAGDPRHVVKSVLLARLHGREIAHVVADGTELALDCDALERVGDHPVVVRVHVALVDQLAVGGEQRVLLVAKLGVCLAERQDRLLGRVQDVRAGRVLGCIERLRGVPGPSELEAVEQPARLDVEPAAERPRLVLGVVAVEAVEVERARVELDRRIAQERWKTVHPVRQAGDEAPQQRNVAGGQRLARRQELLLGLRPRRAEWRQRRHRGRRHRRLGPRWR